MGFEVIRTEAKIVQEITSASNNPLWYTSGRFHLYSKRIRNESLKGHELA